RAPLASTRLAPLESAGAPAGHLVLSAAFPLSAWFRLRASPRSSHLRCLKPASTTSTSLPSWSGLRVLPQPRGQQRWTAWLQPRDSVAGSRQAYDRAVDPRAQGRRQDRAADRHAYRLHHAHGPTARSALRNAVGWRQLGPGDLRPAVHDPGDDGHDVRAWRRG